MTMVFIFTLWVSLMSFNTVVGSPVDGALWPVVSRKKCPITDSKYTYECPDPRGDLGLTSCCTSNETEENKGDDKTIQWSIVYGNVKHKCCIPPLPLAGRVGFYPQVRF